MVVHHSRSSHASGVMVETSAPAERKHIGQSPASGAENLETLFGVVAVFAHPVHSELGRDAAFTVFQQCAFKVEIRLGGFFAENQLAVPAFYQAARINAEDGGELGVALIETGVDIEWSFVEDLPEGNGASGILNEVQPKVEAVAPVLAA